MKEAHCTVSEITCQMCLCKQKGTLQRNISCHSHDLEWYFKRVFNDKTHYFVQVTPEFYKEGWLCKLCWELTEKQHNQVEKDLSNKITEHVGSCCIMSDLD